MIGVITLFALTCFGACAEAEVRGRSRDTLSNDELVRDDEPIVPLPAARAAELGGRQIPLCMIGDSITWAQEGDYWRKWLVRRLPSVAFVGTHTARFGYSHAGEGGNSTVGVLKRIDDRSRVPDCPYYHLMIGINDSSAAKCAADVSRVASNTVASIWKIVDRLLARSCTRKVFLASILPGKFETNPFRDDAGSAANVILRRELRTRYPADRVVWVEYELPLRANLAAWKAADCLSGAHPLKKGYRIIADMLADVLEREVRVPAEATAAANYGVEVENRWDEGAGLSRPLIPGWYVLSFDPVTARGKLKVRLHTETDRPKSTYDKTVELLARPGRRCELEFMTGYEGYGYTERPFHLEVTDEAGHPVAVKDVQIEKMRPSRKASRYGSGTFVDTDSPICAGEWLRSSGMTTTPALSVLGVMR